MQPLTTIPWAIIRPAPWLVLVTISLCAGTAAGSGNIPPRNGDAVQTASPHEVPAKTGVTLASRIASDEYLRAEQDVVAVVNGRTIRAAELDASIRMALHDLDRARYELRFKRLERLIAEQSATADAASRAGAASAAPVTADVRILLEPPPPPRITVNTGDNDVRGNPGAPVTVIEFLDYQSIHSRRVQPVLRQLLEDYGPLVGLVVRDLPLHYHRQARQAAEAAECARAQGEYWRYHDLLLQRQDQLNRSRLGQIAVTLGLDEAQFQACLDTKQGATAVNDDVLAARKLGIDSTPTFFINGLYLKGPGNYSEFARIINRELIRLGFLSSAVVSNLGATRCPFSVAPQSSLSLSLTGTVLNADPRASSAIFHDPAAGSTQTLKPGDRLGDDIELVLVVRDRTYLQRGDQLEYLLLSASPGAAATADESVRTTPMPDTVLTLRRAEVDAALQARDKLNAALASGSLDLEGKRLLKLTSVEPGGLYDLLGLQARDVLMQVDGQWVHSQKNPLWDALRTRKKVTLVIMRKGFPKTFQYVVEDDRP